jgi:hypothetical protein
MNEEKKDANHYKLENTYTLCFLIEKESQEWGFEGFSNK